MATCPRCQRPVAVARPTCFYCGAPLPALPSPPAADHEEKPLAAATRALVVLDLEGAEPERLAAALALTDLEARQWVRRARFHLHRLTEPREAEEERQRLLAHGVVADVVPEAAVQAAQSPVVAGGGRPREGGLELDTPRGPQLLLTRDLLLVVEGPIARDYQTVQDVRRMRTATLEPGHRFHLHRRTEPRPVELDAGGFDFGGARSGISSLLVLREWVTALAGDVPVDDSFRRAIPALGPAGPSTRGPLSAADALGAPLAQEGRALVLDNLPQFRFFSAWRGALQRLRAG